MTRRNNNANAKPEEDAAPQQPDPAAEETAAAEQPDAEPEEASKADEAPDPEAVARFVVRKGYIDKATGAETFPGDIVELSNARAAEINDAIVEALVAVKD